MYSIANCGKPIDLKPCYDLFLFISNYFLEHVARGIISGTITVFVKRDQDNDFSRLC